MRGAVCVLALPDAAGGVHVTERLADALALAARLLWARSMCGPTWTSRAASRTSARNPGGTACSYALVERTLGADR